MNEIVEKTKGSDIIWNPSFFADTYYNAQEKATKSAFNENTTKKLNEFIQLRDDILSLLKVLKKESEKEYLIGFSETYNVIVKFVYDNNFSDSGDYFGITPEGVNSKPYNILSIRHEIYKQAFKKITDTLIINCSADFDKAFDLPSSFTEIKNYINKGLYEMDLFMNGNINEMSYYNIPRAVEKFNSLRFKYENNPKQSLSMLNKYFIAVSTLDNNIDKGIYSNDKIHDDINFTVMCNQLCYFKSDILNLFTADEIAESEPDDLKIIDILDTDAFVEEVKNKKETSIHIAFTYSKKGASFKNNLTEFRKSLIEGGFIDNTIT